MFPRLEGTTVARLILPGLFIFSGFLLASPPYAAGIAYDNATSAGTSGSTTTLTFSYAVGSGANRILFVNVQTFASSLTSVTYNGQALTLIDSYNETYNNSYVHLYYLAAPASGMHNVVITEPSASYIEVTAAF